MSDEYRAPLSPFTEEPKKEKRGFASMDPEKQRAIASKGGKSAHLQKTAHTWTSEEARLAGRKGGQISRGGRGRITNREIAEEEGLLDQPNPYPLKK